MARTLDDILALFAQARVKPRGIAIDSRRVGAGDVFVAWPGAASDGRRFIADALSRGALAVLYEASDDFRPPDTEQPVFAVEGLRALAGHLADALYGKPSERLWLAGVTGTNGKTTVSQWLAHALDALGCRCGVIGTLGNGFPGALAASLNTTPDATELHRLLAGFEASGARAAVMEVSSIGLDQERVNGARFDAAIFTNLTRDHIDYHGSMQAYADAKARLFDLPDVGAAIVDLDDDFGLSEARRLAARGMRVIGYGLAADRFGTVPGIQELAGTNLRASASGLRFDVTWEKRRVELNVRLAGAFNASNLLAVIGALLVYGAELEDIVRVAQTLTPPPGRMQLLGGENAPLIVVDYAHTPDALAKALEASREITKARGGRLVCVFGCGGDRDAGKRPQMGEAASRLADHVIVTSDNPRFEAPRQIIDDILAGAGPATVTVIERDVAIREAVLSAEANDVILVAGKGHEPYQEIRGVHTPFFDLDQAAQALAARGATTP